jgi:hypothetical protein
MMHDNRLTDILLDNIDYMEYKLNEDEKKWIYKFINESSETFNELDTDIKTITEDSSIKIDDITSIIKIIADTYYCAVCKNDSLNSNNLPNFVKYTIHVILDSKLLILSTKDDKERLNNIIDSSMILLNMNLIIDKNEYNKKNCFTCFYNCSFFDLIIKQLKK